MLKKYKNYICCVLICMIHTGLNSIATAASPKLMEYYNCPLSSISFAAAVCCFTMFFSSFIGASFIKKVKPKGAFIISTICAIAYCLCVYFTDNIIFFYIGCGLIGFTISWGSYANATLYINKFNPDKAPKLITMLSAFNMIGSSLFQFVTGILLPKLGLRSTYLVMAIFGTTAIILNILLLDNIDVQDSEASAFERKGIVDFSIYSNPVFQKMGLVVLFGSCFTMIGSLLNHFLLSKGVEATVATTCLSIYTLCGGFSGFFTGSIAIKKGYRSYARFLYLMFWIGLGFALIYDRTSVFAIAIVLLLVASVGAQGASIYNIVSKPLFPDNSLVAQTQLISISSLGSSFIMPLYTKIYEAKGYSVLWITLFFVSVFMFIILNSVLKNVQQTKEK